MWNCLKPSMFKTFPYTKFYSLRQRGYEGKIMVLLLPLLLALGSETALDANVTNLVQWIISQTSEFRSSCVPGLTYIGKKCARSHCEVFVSAPTETFVTVHNPYQTC